MKTTTCSSSDDRFTELDVQPLTPTSPGIIKAPEAVETSGPKAEAGVQPDPAAVHANANEAAHNMCVGGLWLVGGLLVTLVTYQAAANSSGGGYYIVAWGAILFGGLQFLKGIFQSLG